MNGVRGFTVVEIVVTITVMVILLTLGFVGLGASQMRARDAERKADVEDIALHLESYYKGGIGDAGELLGRYPNQVQVCSAIKDTLPNIGISSLLAPSGQTSSCGDTSIVMATAISENPAAVSPQPTIHQYVYQPLFVNGTTWSLCYSGSSQECRRFNLYYRLEADNVVYKIESKNR